MALGDFGEQGLDSNALKTARDDAIRVVKRLNREQFKEELRQRHANVEGMKWLYDWNARNRSGQTDTLAVCRI